MTMSHDCHTSSPNLGVEKGFGLGVLVLWGPVHGEGVGINLSIIERHEEQPLTVG